MKDLFGKIDVWLAGMIVVLVALFVGVGVLNRTSGPPAMRASSAERERRSIDAQMSGWPEKSRLLGEVMTERYGWPDAVAPAALTWNNRGEWKRIVVHRAPNESPLEQAVSYQVPASRGAALETFGHGLRVERALDEMAAQSDREELNILALNLAHRVATGRMTVGDARAAFERTATRAAAGKSSRLMRSLEFSPSRAPRTQTFRWPQPPLY